MSSKTLSVTIPEELYALIDERRKTGHYTRSEFVRDALRRYLAIPTDDATPDEIEAIERGRADFAAGRFVTLEQLLDEMKQSA